MNYIYEIVNHRYLNCLPVIVSSEFGVDTLLDYDEAVGSRVIEMCKGRIIELKGANLNYRLR
jgi:DNA replication protein DnaC